MLNNINLERLQTFVLAARSPTFAIAARQRNLSVSAISQQVRALEGELGQPLFERLGRRVRLTPEGRQLLEVAHVHLGAIDEAISTLGQRRASVSGVVTIGCARTFGQHALLPLIPPLLREAPSLRLQWVFEVPSLLERRLAEGSLDVAVMGKVPEHPGLASEVLTHETFVALAPANTRRKTLTERDARQQRWVVFADDRPMHDAWWKAAFGRRSSSAVTPVVEVPALEWMLDLVAKGVGCAVLPDYLAQRAIERAQVKVLTVAGRRPARAALQLVWRRSQVPTARVDAVLGALRRLAR